MLRRSILIFACGLVSTTAFSNSASTATAQAAAEQWLALVDASDYEKSWQQAGTAFKSAITAQRWAQVCAAARTPLGTVRSRSSQGIEPSATLPGMPDGQYATLKFAATFEHKASAIETVTLILEPDSQWRIVGYFIQ